MKTENAILEEVVKQSILNREENAKRREAFVQENKSTWIDEGEKLKARREKNRMTLRQIGEYLGTSPSRISRIEKGEPVSMADHLVSCYHLLLDYVELQSFVLEFKESLNAHSDMLFNNMLTIYESRADRRIIK